MGELSALNKWRCAWRTSAIEAGANPRCSWRKHPELYQADRNCADEHGDRMWSLKSLFLSVRAHFPLAFSKWSRRSDGWQSLRLTGRNSVFLSLNPSDFHFHPQIV
jgi:hypothetical protein